ncbi:MAG TPA: hypothetical protein VLX61_04370 [Anaerolineales bacterium]|nr:hypothetical protein [Anaerolineales bacterium]
MKKTIETILMILMTVFICACSVNREAENFSIPKADIVYQAINNQLGSTGIVESNNLIGFVNRDGSENKQIKLKYRAYTPVFSMEAGGIYFHLNVTQPPRLIGGSGPIYFLSSSGIYKVCDQLSSSIFTFPLNGTAYLLRYDSTSIDLIDMQSCNIVKSLVQISAEVPWAKFIVSAYPSSSGKSMIFSESYRSPSRDVIYIMDIESGKVNEVFEGGYNASFSPDDQRIAYDGDDGIYVANADGTGKRLLVKIDFSIYKEGLVPVPIWSPDGTTLVYHKCILAECNDDLSGFSIYKVDVNTDVEQKIVDSGLYPIWIR